MADVQLIIDGLSFEGWTSVAITRPMDAAAGVFSLSLTERWTDSMEPWPIRHGDPCAVAADGEIVTVGHVDILSPSFGAEDHTITVQGRDRTADLVDCSAVHTPDEWADIDLLTLCQKLAEPFGVKVYADDGVPLGRKFRTVKLQQGETALEAIARHVRQRQLLVMPDAAGDLRITRTARKRAGVVLEQGVNILSASGVLDDSQRHSDYIVKGQSGYSIETTPDQEALIQARARDPGVARYRPLLVIAETGITPATAKDRAAWESKVRLGRVNSVTVTVQGWRQYPGGPLWEPNTIVPIRSSWLRLDGELLIREVTFTKSLTNGTQTRLALISPDAYLPEPIEDEESGGMWGEAIRRASE